MLTSGYKKKGMGDLAIFIVLAIAVFTLLIVANYFGKAVGLIKEGVKVKGIVDFYVNLDDKGTEFAFLEAKSGEHTFMETLGLVASKGKMEGDLKTQMGALEAALDKIISSSDKKNYYIAVTDQYGDMVYEKKTANPPVIAGIGAEDLELRWPLERKNDVITSGFGFRKDPFTNKNTFHGAIDIRGQTGEPVYSATDGEVVRAEMAGDFGNLVVVKYVSPKTKTPYLLYYGHLSSFSVRKNEDVKKGDEIGKVGTTGRSEAPHLHFEVRKDENGDGNYVPGEESVNLCQYLENPEGTGPVDLNTCLKPCSVFGNPSICGTDVSIVKNRFDLPLLRGKKGSVELVLW